MNYYSGFLIVSVTIFLVGAYAFYSDSAIESEIGIIIGAGFCFLAFVPFEKYISKSGTFMLIRLVGILSVVSGGWFLLQSDTTFQFVISIGLAAYGIFGIIFSREDSVATEQSEEQAQEHSRDLTQEQSRTR